MYLSNLVLNAATSGFQSAWTRSNFLGYDMQKNVASQSIGVQMVSATDGSAFTGSVTVYVTGDAGTQAVGSVGSGACTHEGNGYHTYAPSQAETNYDLIGFTFIGTGAVPVTVQVFTGTPQSADHTSNISAILTDTAEIGTAGAGLTEAGGTGDQFTGIASVGSVTGGINTSAGTITTLDALDTAQDSQHSATQSLIGTPSDFGSGTSTIAANLQDIADNGTATYDRATDSLQAIRDRGDSSWTTGAGGTPPQLLQSTTIATLASQTSFTLTAGSADDDAYNGSVVVVTDQATSTQKAVGSVLDYTGSTKTVTLVSDPAIFTMAVGDTIDIIANASTAPTAAAVADAVWDEPQSGHVSVGSFGEIATEIASILADTGTDGVVISASTQQAIADALLNRDMSAVSDTNARTPLNALRFLRNKWSVSGTTLTVTKEDDSTSAWTATVTTNAAADPVTGSDPV